jgi:hypothetical protein
MSQPDIVAALIPVAEALDRLRIPYYVGGSIASSAHGFARATVDIDLVVRIAAEQVPALVEQLQDAYYIDADAFLAAIHARAPVNLIHLATMIKVDFFVVGTSLYEQEVLRRVQPGQLDEDVATRLFPLPTPEDVVLAKLSWYEQGNRTSEHQWRDLLGVLAVQGPAIDRDYLRLWAARLGVTDLLERALREVDAP